MHSTGRSTEGFGTPNGEPRRRSAPRGLPEWRRHQVKASAIRVACTTSHRSAATLRSPPEQQEQMPHLPVSRADVWPRQAEPHGHSAAARKGNPKASAHAVSAAFFQLRIVTLGVLQRVKEG